MTNLVIPQPDELGLRVTTQTPLAKVVGVLRRHNPRASFAELRSAAAALIDGEWPTSDVELLPADPETFELAAEVAEPLAPVDAVEAIDTQAQLDAWQPERTDVAAWVARQRGLAKGLAMSKSGRVPARVLTAYREAHRDDYLASLVPVEGGDPMPAEPLD